MKDCFSLDVEYDLDYMHFTKTDDFMIVWEDNIDSGYIYYDYITQISEIKFVSLFLWGFSDYLRQLEYTVDQSNFSVLYKI